MISIFSLLFLVYNHNFITYIDFTSITDSNKVTDRELTNQVINRKFNRNI